MSDSYVSPELRCAFMYSHMNKSKFKSDICMFGCTLSKSWFQRYKKYLSWDLDHSNRYDIPIFCLLCNNKDNKYDYLTIRQHFMKCHPDA